MGEKRIWSVPFVIVICINFFDSMSHTMPSFLMTSYALGLGISQALAATLVSVLSVASLVMRPVAGRLVDAFNNKRLLLLAILGELFAMVLYLLAYNYWTLMLARLVHGLSFGLSAVCAITIAGSLLPEEKIGSGIAIYGMGNTVCVICATKIGQLISSAFGPKALFVACLICSTCALLLTCALPQKAPQKKLRQKQTLRQFFGSLYAKEALPFAFLYFLFSGSQAINSAFMVLYFAARAKQGVPIGDAGIVLMLWGIAIFIFRPFVGRIIDRYGPAKAAILCMTGSWTYSVLLGLTPNTAVTYLGTFFLGGFGGCSASVLQAAAYATAPMGKKGVANSTNLMGGDIGTAVGGTLIGLCVAALSSAQDPTIGYRISYLLCAIPLLIGILFCFLLRKKPFFRPIAAADQRCAE